MMRNASRTDDLNEMLDQPAQRLLMMRSVNAQQHLV